MKSSIILATLLSLAAAELQVVTITNTPCPSNPNLPIKTFTVTVNDVGITKTDGSSICGLRIQSVSSGPDPAAISCQAFQDAEGKVRGSDVFTVAKAASIGLNPKTIGSVWCRTPRYNGPGASSTASVAPSASMTVVPSAAVTMVNGTALATPTNSAAPAAPTDSVAPAVPAPGGNTTVPVGVPGAGAGGNSSAGVPGMAGGRVSGDVGVLGIGVAVALVALML